MRNTQPIRGRFERLSSKISLRLTLGYYTMKARQFASLTPSTKRVAIRLVQSMIPDRPVGTGASRVGVDVAAAAEDLKRDGFVRMGSMLDRATIDELIEYTDQQSARDPWDPSSSLFSARSPPATCHTAQYFRGTLLACERIHELANDPRVLDIAKRFLGATPTISDLNSWWSFPQTAPREAQLFHRDRDDLRFCKLMIYLTDVDMSTGPHVFVRGSTNEERLLEPRRFSDAEVENAFGKDRIEYFCHPAGSAFMVDTSGLHKGLVPTGGRRLILEVHYSLMPIGRERYDRDPRRPLGADRDKYINRLVTTS